MFRSLSLSLARQLVRLAARLDRNLAGATLFEPGNYYSPLLDLHDLARDPKAFLNSSARGWDHIDLCENVQAARLEQFLAIENPFPFPEEAGSRWRYYSENDFFVYADAFALAGMMATEKPRRIVEVGSGFSSALMLDVREHFTLPTELTFIEPYPERLKKLMRELDYPTSRLLAQPVQQVALEEFTRLESGDFLFIDSSHVAKAGSDLSDLLLRVLPVLQPGVWVHFHDIFYPGPYPTSWLLLGRAWNEVPFLQAFLMGNRAFTVEWFNSFARERFRERLAAGCPHFLKRLGGSLWLRRVGE